MSSMHDAFSDNNQTKPTDNPLAVLRDILHNKTETERIKFLHKDAFYNYIFNLIAQWWTLVVEEHLEIYTDKQQANHRGPRGEDLNQFTLHLFHRLEKNGLLEMRTHIPPGERSNTAQSIDSAPAMSYVDPGFEHIRKSVEAVWGCAEEAGYFLQLRAHAVRFDTVNGVHGISFESNRHAQLRLFLSVDDLKAHFRTLASMRKIRDSRYTRTTDMPVQDL